MLTTSTIDMKTMMLSRRVFTNSSTIGKLTLNDFTCWTLEPPERKVGMNPVCIPAGRYKVKMRWSEKHQMEVPGLLDVPKRFDIEIHPGNYPKDSLGCILPGKIHGVDYVSESRKTCEKLFSLIREALKEGEFSIDVIG